MVGLERPAKWNETVRSSFVAGVVDPESFGASSMSESVSVKPRPLSVYCRRRGCFVGDGEVTATLDGAFEDDLLYVLVSGVVFSFGDGFQVDINLFFVVLMVENPFSGLCTRATVSTREEALDRKDCIGVGLCPRVGHDL